MSSASPTASGQRALARPWRGRAAPSSHSPACGPSTATQDSAHRPADARSRAGGARLSASHCSPTPRRRNAACPPRALRARGRSAREAAACPPAHAPRRRAPAPSRRRPRQEEEHVLVRRARRRHQVEQRHQRPGRDAGLLLAFAPRGIGDVLAALDPPGRHSTSRPGRAPDAHRAGTGGSARSHRAPDRPGGSPTTLPTRTRRARTPRRPASTR